MKQMKFIVVAVMAVLMSMSVTSCMKGDDNPNQTAGGIVEISSYMGLTSMTMLDGGYKILPLNTTVEKIFPSDKMGYVVYSFDPNSEANVNFQSTKTISANLEYAVSIDNAVEVASTKGAPNDSVGDASIKGIQNIIDSGAAKFTIKKDKAIMGVEYYMTKKEHYTSLVCYSDEMTSSSTDLVLYLKHDMNGDDKNASGTSYNYYQSGYIPFYIKSFDLNQAISAFRRNVGNEPQNIVIKASVSNNLDLVADKDYTSYSVPYTTK